MPSCWAGDKELNPVVPVLEFLLEAEPTSPYRPRVRLTACLPENAGDPWPGRRRGDPDVQQLVEAALYLPDLTMRRRMADLLSVTDQPGLLDALEEAFRQTATSRWHVPDLLPPDSWHSSPPWLIGEPDSLLAIVCANPHLPRPPALPDDPYRALLALMKDRLDLLQAYNRGLHATHLFDYLGAELPDEVRDQCRRALRSLSAPWDLREVCDRAWRGDREAVAAARDAGYRPDNPALLPLFLLLTRQFDAYREVDPHGRVLQHIGAGRVLKNDVHIIIDRILSTLSTKLPDDVAAAVRRSLRDLVPPADPPPFEDAERLWMREALMAHALRLQPEAVAAVVNAGYLPEAADDRLPLLFITEQWDRYDQEDPDGSRLTAALAGRRHRYKRKHFQTVAQRVGRPDPWPPEPQQPPGRPSSPRPGGNWPTSYGADATGGSSSGGYSGGGFSF